MIESLHILILSPEGPAILAGQTVLVIVVFVLGFLAGRPWSSFSAKKLDNETLTTIKLDGWTPEQTQAVLQGCISPMDPSVPVFDINKWRADLAAELDKQTGIHGASSVEDLEFEVEKPKHARDAKGRFVKK